MSSLINITEEEWEGLYKSLKKNKLIVSRPSNVSIIKNQNYWKVSLTFNSSSYQRSSCYMKLKPVWNFIKEKIRKLDSISSIHWEIVRE